ncbi:hypothetical protein [Laribacter hongkongensis]|uniref:hypothetical protein n=1 Tax=Laribacter hongkongensis TaxID=168471 RepID=UPI001EFEE921|nr:hypothetical protein [Laribacter hongkongensis]MCG9042294.1 hypothetical protein [Laribacter hongkongensis]MCG9056927.1 hypothetical protein [Laribacter hongkongensis]MCG9069037.1 hypothetical protein [Laribacter hongkongensis]
MAQLPSEAEVLALLDTLEASVATLEDSCLAAEWGHFSVQLAAFFQAEQALGCLSESHPLGAVARSRLLVVVEQFSRLLTAVEVQRDDVGKELAELANRSRQVARINRAYGDFQKPASR